MALSLSPATAQAPDPGALHRGFHQDRLDSRIQQLDRQSLRGDLDGFGRRDLMDRRSERDALNRPSTSPAPGPYRDPVDGRQLLQPPPGSSIMSPTMPGSSTPR